MADVRLVLVEIPTDKDSMDTIGAAVTEVGGTVIEDVHTDEYDVVTIYFP